MKGTEHTPTAEELLTKAGIKLTANRVLVMRELMRSERPASLIEIETALETLDRSSVLRVLTLLAAHELIHTFEDGRGVTKYEICRGEDHCTIEDMHAHFYCEKCRKVYCFEQISAPRISLPAGFEVHSVNYMLKGECPTCRKK